MTEAKELKWPGFLDLSAFHQDEIVDDMQAVKNADGFGAPDTPVGRYVRRDMFELIKAENQRLIVENRKLKSDAALKRPAPGGV